MKEFEKAKKEYDNIAIPSELSARVTQEIERANTERSSKMKQAFWGKWAATAAAVLLVGFGIGLNTSPVFAKAMENVPLIGPLAQVLTFRQYEENTEDYTITVEIPTIEMISTDFAGLQESVNKEIYALCEKYAEQSKEDALAYRDAFLATGGTLDEWKEHDIRIKVSYAVLLQTDEYLSLSVKRTESWNVASAQAEIFNLDLKTGEQVSLETVMNATGTHYYEDNFAVEADAAKNYAEKIKEAVANKDIEALGNLTAYPVYVGLDNGMVIESKEAFVALGAEKVFAESFVTVIENADISNLTPSRAGFVISDGTSANIIFGIVDGQLKITGINY